MNNNAENENAIRKMATIRKIVNSGLDDLSAYYILMWFDSGWRDEEWVDKEIEFRKTTPIKNFSKES